MLEYLFELGPVIADSMGRRPIHFSDIGPWSAHSGPSLTAWEARTLVNMSHMYMLGLQTGERGEPIPLYDDDDSRRQSIAEKIKMAFTKRAGGVKRKSIR